MTDEPFYSPKARPAPPRQPRPGELLFEFQTRAGHFVCELHDHGEYGAEAQFLLNGELHVAKTFQDLPEFGVHGRALAIAWANSQRTAIEARDRP